MPIVIQRNKLFIGLLGLAVNSEFNYPNYFAMIPSGPDPKPSFTKGFFDTAMAQTPKPATVAIVAADQEFSRNASDGARENAKKAGLKIVYDKTYPPSTTDFAPIVRAIQATNPDLVVLCSYPPDSVGLVAPINEIGFKPKMIGGGMVGLQATALKTQLGPGLNGFVNYDFWLPVPKMKFPGVEELLKKYQARRRPRASIPSATTWRRRATPSCRCWRGDRGDKGLEDRKLADYIRANSFKTVLGDVRFGKNGEWAESRVLQVQFQDVKGNDVEQFRTMGTQTLLTPELYNSGQGDLPVRKGEVTFLPPPLAGHLRGRESRREDVSGEHRGFVHPVIPGRRVRGEPGIEVLSIVELPLWESGLSAKTRAPE